MVCYDPRVPADRAKAESGLVSDRCEFLGCEITSHGVRPSAANRRKLLAHVGQIIQSAEKRFGSPKAAMESHATLTETMRLSSMVIQGWANTFGFCTDTRVMGSLDTELSAQIEDFIRRTMTRMRTLSPTDRRRLLGVFPIADRAESMAIKLLRSLELASSA